MIIQNIKIQNIRSYEFAELPINKGINAIYGNNGSGKTSLLEAIYFGLSLKSFRTPKTEQIIRNNELKGEILITSNNKTIRAIKNKEKYSGCTVHYVNEKLDGGKIIMQRKVKILKNDNYLSLKKRIQKEEYKLYPESIIKIFD